MIAACPQCKTRLNIPDEKIKPDGLRFRCPKCAAVLSFRGKAAGRSPGREKQAGPARQQASPAMPPRSGEHREKKQGKEGAGPQGEAVHGPSPAEKTGPPAEFRQPEKTGRDGGEGETGPDVPSAEEMDRIQKKYGRQGYPSLEKERIEDRPFLEYLPDVFVFPFQKGGILMLVIGTVFITVTLFFARYAFIFGVIGAAFVYGYIASYMMKIVAHSADGEPDIPDWPDVSDMWDDIFRPMFQLITVSLVSFSPLILFMIFFFSPDVLSIMIAAILVLLGTLYQPMALIAMSLFRSARALSPAILFPAIAKVPLDYAIACGMMFMLFVFKAIFNYFIVIPLAGPFIDNLIMLYFLIVEMRILGLIYYANREKIGWFGE